MMSQKRTISQGILGSIYLSDRCRSISATGNVLIKRLHQWRYSYINNPYLSPFSLPILCQPKMYNKVYK